MVKDIVLPDALYIPFNRFLVDYGFSAPDEALYNLAYLALVDLGYIAHLTGSGPDRKI